MIDLRGLVAVAGQAPLTGSVRVGEVVRLDGPPALARAVLEVIAGRRAPLAGEVGWRDPAGRGVLIRAGEALPPGIDAGAATTLWRALVGGDPRGGSRRSAASRRVDGPRGSGVAAAARGLGGGPTLWLIDGALATDVAAVVATADEQVRGGDGALLWTAAAARGPADRVIVVAAAGADRVAAEAGGAGASAAGAGAGVSTGVATGAATAAARRLGWSAELTRASAALIRFAGGVAASRGALATAAVSALGLALVAAVVATHEGFWFDEGRRAGLAWLARLAALGAAGVAAVAAATRAAVGQAWPAMLRETGAARWLQRLALGLGDAAGAAPTAAIAAWPALWMAAALDGAAGLARAAVVAIAVLVGAVAAGAATRVVGARAAVGAVVGVGVALGLMW